MGALAFLLYGLVAVVAVTLYRILQWQALYQKMPHRPAQFLLGHLRTILTADKQGKMHNFFIDSSKLGRVTSWWSPFMAGVVVSDPELIKEVMTNEDVFFVSKNFANAFRAVSNGLLVLDGPVWKRHRRLVQPAFFPEHMRNVVLVVNREIGNLISEWATSIDKKTHVSCQAFNKFTMDVITHSAFGVIADNPDLNLSNIVQRGIEQVQRRISFPPTLWEYLLNDEGEFQLNIKKLRGFVRDIVEQRQKQVTKALGVEKDLLDLLLSPDASGDKLTTEELVDETLMFFLAGHETTSNSLAWICYNLSIHQDVQQKLYEEVKRHKASVSWEDLGELKYTEQVIKETLRLFPVAPVTGRTCHDAVELGGCHIPADSTIIIDFVSAHRNPSLWDRPETFMPERFAIETPAPGVYSPFGVGPKNCIGQRMAMIEMKIALARIVSNFKLRLVDNHPVVDDECYVTLHPAPFVHLHLERRG